MTTEPTPLTQQPKFIFACGVAVGAGLMLALDLINEGTFSELIKFVAGAYLAGGGG